MWHNTIIQELKCYISLSFKCIFWRIPCSWHTFITVVVIILCYNHLRATNFMHTWMLMLAKHFKFCSRHNIIILSVKCYIFIVFKGIFWRAFCSCHILIIAVINLSIAAYTYQLAFTSLVCCLIEALISFCTWNCHIFAYCLVLGRYASSITFASSLKT